MEIFLVRAKKFKNADKFGKKFGAKVELVPQPGEKTVSADDLLTARNDEGTYLEFKNWVQNKKGLDFDDEDVAYSDELWSEFLTGSSGSGKAWTLPITPKMRDSVLKKGVTTIGVAGVAAGAANQDNQQAEMPGI